MKRLIFSIVIAFTLSQATAQFTPDQLPGLSLWLRSDSGVVLNGNKVSIWNDLSGSGNNCLQVDTAQQPILVPNVLCGRPVLRFDGFNDMLNGDTINGISDSSMTVFIIASGENMSEGDNYSVLFSIKSNIGFTICRHLYISMQREELFNDSYELDALNNSLPNAGFPATLFIVKKVLNTSLQLTLDSYSGIGYGVNASAPFPNDAYKIGYDNGVYTNYWKGDVAEMIIYSNALSNSDMQSVISYIEQHYAGGCITVGIRQEISPDSEIAVYPNPSTDQVNIETAQNATIEISNIQGQIVMQQKLQQGTTNIDIREFAKGVYILKLQINNRTEVMRIIKE